MYFNRLQILEKLGKSFEDLNSDWQELLQKFPDKDEVKEEYADFLESHHKYSEVLQLMLDKYLKTDSKWSVAHMIAEIYFLLNKKDKGIEFLENSVKQGYGKASLRNVANRPEKY